jgi:hypothetical protein
MFLGYTDDSGRFDKKQSTYRILSTVLMRDRLFSPIEHVIGNLFPEFLPEEKWESFEEFHAWELFGGGYGIFDGIDQQRRFAAIESLLTIIPDYKLPIVYGAVDVRELQRRHYGSADPIDVAFRLCLEGISTVMGTEQSESHGTEFALLIVDDTNRDNKKRLKQTYRELRKQVRPPHWHPGTWYIHDDMYFGDSKDSIGIQLADLCSYFIGKHLESDAAAEHFYQIFSDQIAYSCIEPQQQS